MLRRYTFILLARGQCHGAAHWGQCTRGSAMGVVHANRFPGQLVTSSFNGLAIGHTNMWSSPHSQ